MDDTTLTPARLQRLKALFDATADVSTDEREAFLNALAGDDRLLANEVRSLLAAHDSTGEHLISPLPISLAPDEPPEDRWTGTRIGVYAVGARIGEGGMGTVYAATRADDQFEKRVAIKLLRRSAESDLAISRFRYERQILANLNHPNIAGLVDGGVAPDGRPYFAMEYVDGAPITTWCDARRLGVRGRLVLFLQVCAAVQHAHQQLVIHRDLKPGNILVTDDGTVKLLDFGIAKLLREEEGLEQLPATRGGARVFTPEYAAPEQVRGLPVSTATDVYALGIVLFELLTGGRPFALQGRLMAEIEEIVCREPPPRPSMTVQPEMPARLGLRSTGQVRSHVVGDLDAIVLTALRKEPDRRYGSADQLARDIGAYLDGLPVSARPDALGYRLTKFVRRRAVELVAGSLVVATLLGGVIATTRQARAAEAERERATAVTEFFTTMLAAPDPGELGREVTMREVLDSAAVRADSLTDRPVLAAEVREVIAETYSALGELELARDQFTRALAFRRLADPEGSRATAVTLAKLGITHGNLGDYEASDSVLAESEAMLQRTADADDMYHGTVRQARGSLRQEFGDLPGAEAMLRDALAFRLRVAPDDHVNLTPSYNDLGVAVGQQGRFAEAESLHVMAVRSARLAYGDEHPILAATLAQHAFALAAAGKTAAADSLFQVTIAMRRRILGETHPDFAWSLFQYAQFLNEAGKWEEAVVRGREVLALRGRSLPETHIAVATALQVVGIGLSRLDSLGAAEQYLRESLDLRRRTLPDGHWLVHSGEGVLGEHLVRAGRFAEAESLLLRSAERLTALRGTDSPQAQDAHRRLVALYEAWQRPMEAARWQAAVPPSR